MGYLELPLFAFCECNGDRLWTLGGGGLVVGRSGGGRKWFAVRVSISTEAWLKFRLFKLFF